MKRLRLAPNERKYSNIHTEIDGITFDSKIEARRYQQLKLLLHAGAITGLVLQPKYQLLASFKDREGKRWREIGYVGDFFYYEGEQPVVEDVKGKVSAVFLLKEKMFRQRYPEIKLVVVKDL